MIVYSSENGNTVVDNAPHWITDDVQVEELYDDFDQQAITTEIKWIGEWLNDAW